MLYNKYRVMNEHNNVMKYKFRYGINYACTYLTVGSSFFATSPDFDSPFSSSLCYNKIIIIIINPGYIS